MPKTKTKKVYTTTIADGRLEIKLIVPTTDGKDHTASAPYPMYVKEGGVAKRVSKKETEKQLFEHIKQYVKVQQGRRKQEKPLVSPM